jgi:hypothetical protein
MSTFQYINKQGVQAESGFIVQRTTRFTAEYREFGRTIVIDVESGMVGDKAAICYSSSAFFAWDPRPEEQQRVEANFREAMQFQGLIPEAS